MPFILSFVDEEKVILENMVRTPLESAKYPYISSDVKYITITRGDDHILSLIKDDGKIKSSCSWGRSGFTLLSESYEKLRKECVKFIEQDYNISLDPTAEKKMQKKRHRGKGM